MNVFVSYTRRDGIVTMSILERFHTLLSSTCTPFIHAVAEPNLKHQQLAVLGALARCHAIILIISPGVFRSPWVRLELALGKLLRRPIFRLDVSELLHLQDSTHVDSAANYR